MVIEVTDATFKTEVEDYQGTVVADFWATWCRPCTTLAPVVESLSNELTNVKFVKIEADVNLDLSKRYNVRGIPALLLFKNGQVKKQSMGVQTLDALRTWVTTE